MTNPITNDDSIKKIILWILFTTEIQKNVIYDDSINSFSYIRIFSENLFLIY